MSIGAQVTYLGFALQQRLSTALVWLADAIAFLSRTVWPLVDLLIRIWIGRQALVLSVLISTNWAMAVSMAAVSDVACAGWIQATATEASATNAAVTSGRARSPSGRRDPTAWPWTVL